MNAAFRLSKVQSPLVITALFGVILIVASLVFYSIKLAEINLHATKIRAIIDIPMRSAEPNFYYDFLRDPELLAKKPEDDRDAARLASEITEFRSDLTRARGERAFELNEMAYQGYAAIAYYLEDIINGKIKGDQGAAQKNLASIRKFLLQHANQAAKLSNSPRQKSQALYHALVTQYQIGNNPSVSVQGLNAITKENSQLPSALKLRASLLINLEALENKQKRQETARELVQIARSLEGSAAFVARIGAARAYAGLKRNGQKLIHSDPLYRGQLSAAAQIAKNFEGGQRDEALIQLITVWRRAESESADWSKVPFNLSPFADNLLAKGIVERDALADWYKGQLPSAIKKYEVIAKSLAGHKLRASLDLRVLDLHRLHYARTKEPKSYQKTLLAKQKAYLDPGLLGEGRESEVRATAQEVERRHAALILAEYARVTQTSTTSSQRQEAINMANRFLASVEFRPEFESIKEKLAQIYVLNKQPKKAVTIYQELAQTGSNPKKYYGLAISVQSSVARWPVELPWRIMPAARDAEREELASLYGKYIEASGGPKNAGWFALAHQGLLLHALGRTEESFQLWQTQLDLDSRGPIAAQAAGMMLSLHQKSGAWDEVEELARFCLQKNISPLFNGQAISVKNTLGLALLEGGTNALNANQYQLAVKKLAEFVSGHGQASRHDEGMLKLAYAYRGAGLHKDAITTLVSMVERHPGSKLQRQALLDGGDWAVPMAYEENAMFFYGLFLKRFSQDREADRVRLASFELSMGRGLYQQASESLLAYAQSAKIDGAQRSRALSQLLDIEVRYGSAARAEKLADQMIASNFVTQDDKANAYNVKSDFFEKRGDIRGLQSVLSGLRRFDSTPAVLESIAKTQFILAQFSSRDLVREYDNLSLQNPQQVLAQSFESWNKVKSSYEAVCASGKSSFCPIAMYELARLAIQFSRSLEDVQVQSTLAKEVVAKFNAQKQFIFNEVAKVAQKSDATAYAAVRRGESAPDTTQAVIWQNSSDWNFDRISGETGNAYVQWFYEQDAGAN